MNSWNNTAIYVDPNLKFTKVNKVCAIQMISDDPDKKSETRHIRKIYPNQTNTTITKANYIVGRIFKNLQKLDGDTILMKVDATQLPKKVGTSLGRMT